MQHPYVRTAFGQVLGHPTKPGIRFMFPPPDGDGAAGGGSSNDGTTSGDDGAGDGLGDKGKQALDRMKAERNDARQEAAAWKALGLTLDEVKDLQAKASNRSDQQPAPDEEAIRRQAQENADRAAEERFAVQARKTAVREQARALGFHSAADALTEIQTDDLAKVAVIDDEADADAIAALVKAVAERKPYLVKARDASHGDAGIGGAGSSTLPEPRTPAERMARAYASSSTK